MAIPAGVTQVVLVGTSPGGEEFATGFWIDGGNPGSSSAANTFAASIAAMTTFTALLTAARGLMATDQAFTQVRVYSYAAGGTTADYVGFANLTGQNGSGSGGNALQIAAVATLQTDLAGRRNRGRMYWPVSATGAMQAHQLSGVQTALCNPLAAFFSAINARTDVGGVAVVSRVGATVTPVTSVKVDTRPDVQRRRAASYAATSTFTAAVTP